MPSLLRMLAAASLALAGLGAQRPPSSELCARFSGFDHDGDGAAEIETLTPLFAYSAAGPRVLVLVEARLLAALPPEELRADAPDLAPRLARLGEDLAAEGHDVVGIAVALAPSPRHQDGRVLLALRELLRAAAAERPLAGALLVGRFPDAWLVRTCNWRKQTDLVLYQGTEEERRFENVPYLRRVPEAVAHRADIVLADLDGRWEDVYTAPRTRLPTVYAVYPDGVPADAGVCAAIERGEVFYEDFFHVDDGTLEVGAPPHADGVGAGTALRWSDDVRDHECGEADRARPNALACPDILVSRLDARGTALRPKRSIRGAGGRTLLDERGRPRAVTFAQAGDLPHWRDALWEPDPALERRLLADYLDRNHAFRTGAARAAWRPASLACGLGSGYGVVRGAASDWQDEDRAALDVHGQPTLADAVAWLRRPAVLRTLRAHSDPWGSAFAKGDPAALDAMLGGPAWSWTPRGNRLEPSLAAACGGGKLDWFLLRSLWEYGLIGDAPAFWHHTGCEAISPPGSARLPFDDPAYGQRQGAEALLFFAGGLALIGRAKVFYDEPAGFAETLAAGETFGAAWARSFAIQSAATSWDRVGGDIGRKRAYFWSVLGDWTLRLRR